MPLPPPISLSPQPGQTRGAREKDLTQMPGGVSNTTHGDGVRRRVGYALGFKNVGYSEGFDDYSTARERLSVVDVPPRAQVHTPPAEVGQGLVTLQAQIADTELNRNQVVALYHTTQ